MKINKNKKLSLVTIAIFAVVMIFSACREQARQGTQIPAEAQEQKQVEQTQPERNILIVYFSHSGNTQAVAQYIQSFIGGDLVQIKPEQAYPDDRDALLAQGREEFSGNLRPALANKIENIEDYDTVFVGFPIWFSSVPMLVLTFLETYDFANKTIIPFSTRGGGDIGESVERIRAALPNLTVLDGFHDVNRANFSRAQELTEVWLESAGFSQK